LTGAIYPMYIAPEILLCYVAAASIEATQRHGAIHRGRVRHHHVVAYVALILRVLRLMRMRCTPRPTRVQVMYLQHVRICPQFFLLSGERWHIFCCLVIATGGVVVPGFLSVWVSVSQGCAGLAHHSGYLQTRGWVACIFAPSMPAGGRGLCLT
jgi:hypothetical protein